MKIEFKHINTNEIKTFTNEEELNTFIKNILPCVIGKITKKYRQYGEDIMNQKLTEFFLNKLKYWNDYIDEWKLESQQFNNEEALYMLNKNNEPQNVKKQKKNNQKQRGNGEGSFYYSDKLQKWVGQYGRKTITQRKNESKTECKERWEKLKSQIKGGFYIEKSKRSINNILEEYIENQYKTNQIITSAYRRKLYNLKELNIVCNDIMDIPIQKITTTKILKVLPNMTKYSDSVIGKIYALLYKAFVIAVQERLITFNPMDNESIKKPKAIKPKKEIHPLTIEEQKKLTNTLFDIAQNDDIENYNDKQCAQMCLLELTTGVRVGENGALDESCIDLEKGILVINRTLTRDEEDKYIMGKSTKTEAGNRIVYLSNIAKKVCAIVLKNRINNLDGLLFYDYKNKKFISCAQVNSFLKKINKKYNITNKQITSHILRHSYATMYFAGTGNIKALQKNLGHKKIITTMDTYVEADDNLMQQENLKYEDYLERKGII